MDSTAKGKQGLSYKLRYLADGARKRAYYLLHDDRLPDAFSRPGTTAMRAMVVSPSQPSAMAGIKILSQGGNAIDAAAAVGLADTVVNPQKHSLGGEVTLLIFLASENRVVAVNGNTVAPQEATIDFYHSRGISAIPWDGLLSAGVPGMLGGWLTALDRFGSLSFSEVAQPALDLARGGYIVSEQLHDAIVRRKRRFLAEWQSSIPAFLRDGEVPPVGSVMANEELAMTFGRLMKAEESALARGADRAEALQAVKDLFYSGEIAEEIVHFNRRSGGMLGLQDMAAFSAPVEEPLSVQYRGHEVYKAKTWCQGAVLLQALNILEGYDLSGMDGGGEEFIHTVVEAEKLAFADREQYYGDPSHVDVPVEQLLSKEYAGFRRLLISRDRASFDHRPGEPRPVAPLLEPSRGDGNRGPLAIRTGTMAQGVNRGDTIHFDVADQQGNMVAATSSGGMMLFSPVVEGLGFALSTRLQMFSLDRNHPNCLAPGKRPRTTVSPTLVLRNGRPFAALGSPGGDSQEQVTLQALIGMIDRGMPIQRAFEQPLFLTRHFPSSFHPHTAVPGSVLMEGRIPVWTELQLRRKGHAVSVHDCVESGLVGVELDPATGVLHAGVDPRTAIREKLEVCAIGY